MPRKAKPPSEKPDTLRITINPIVRTYLRQFVATGLYGNSDPDAALRLIQAGIERSIESHLIVRITPNPTKTEK